jgi:two-component system, OmpR family, KDP operon response regulator KdpE
MTLRRKLLVIDDDPAIFRYLRRNLGREGYDVRAAPRQDILARMDGWQPDVVLLDIASADSKSQILAIKARSPAPLIGLMEENHEAIIDALDAGVDDCVTKPFSLTELGAHIRKALRRDMWCRGKTPSFESPALRIDLVLRRIYRCGRWLALSPQQFQLLQLLLDADGGVLAYSDLVYAIWGVGGRGSVALLRKLILDLRRKVEPNPKQPVYILSHSRIGYRFDRSQHRW